MTASVSSSVRNQMSRWIQAFSRVGHDGIALSKALWTLRRQQGSSMAWKPVLLEQAKQSNQVALSLLKMEKEMGLVQYWGLSGYVQQRIRPMASFSTTKTETSSSFLESTQDNDSSNNNKKKIAFMITSSMKQELKDTLQYDDENIKKMTPLQASLVLNHQVSPQQYKDQIPILEAEYEQQMEQERKQEEQERLEAEAAATATTATTGVPPPSMFATSPQGEEHQYKFDFTSSSLTPKMLADALGIEDGFEDTWYEVVEIKPNGQEVRQGLYQSKEEAELGMETREMIRDRQREKDHDKEGLLEYSEFEIRQMSKNDILQE